MVNYCDIIVTDGEIPIVSFFQKRPHLLGSEIRISGEGSRVFTGIHTKRQEDIALDFPVKEYLELTVELVKGTSKHTFPVSIMKITGETRYIICDIDFTISATSLYEYVTNNLLHMKTIVNSSDILGKLAERFKIIYLTGRHYCYTKQTKLWLKKNGFPDGPILSRKEGISFNLKAYKTAALAKIVSVSAQGIGIGDLRSDIEAYRAHHLPAVQISHPVFFRSNDSYTIKPGNVYKVKSWRGIEKLFNDKFI